MINLKYMELVAWYEANGFEAPQLNHPCLAHPLRVFCANLGYVFFLGVLPATSVKAAKVAQLARDFASLRISGKLESVDTQTEARIAELSKSMYREVDLAYSMPATARAKTMMQYAAVFVESQGEVEPRAALGIRQLFASILISAWTAFEVVAEDVWVACLNERPRLGFLAMQAEPDPDDDESDRERKLRVKFEIPAWMLKRHGLDLTKKMGTLLSAKWDFARRDKAEEAYRRAFAEDQGDIETILRSNDLRWLAALRNAFVHNAGIAGPEFAKLVKRHPILSQVPENTPIPLDGELVTSFIGAVIEKGKSLLAFADEWLKNNPV